MIVLFIFIIFLAGLIQSFGGFGAGLIAIPVLTFLWEPKIIIPPFAFLFWIVTISLLLETKKEINWKRITGFVKGGIIGIPVGIYTLKYVNPEIIRGFIYLITILFGISFLSGTKLHLKETSLSKAFAGIISGFLGGSSSMGGPPLIIFGVSLGWPKETFRSTLLGYFLIEGLIMVPLLTVNKLLNFSNIRFSLIGFVPAFLGVFLGVRIKNRISEDKFRKAIILLIILIGTIGFFSILSKLPNLL